MNKKRAFLALIICQSIWMFSACHAGNQEDSPEYVFLAGETHEVSEGNNIFDLDETIKIEEYIETSIPELIDYKKFVEEQSSGEAHLIVEIDFLLLKIGEEKFYPVYVGEQWEDHRVNWERFYVSEQMDEILWYNLVDDEFYSLEEWRNSKEYRTLD